MKQYYMVLPDGSQSAPMSAEELVRNGLNANSYVWADGMSEWAQAKDVPELKAILSPGNPPMMPPRSKKDEMKAKFNQKMNKAKGMTDNIRRNVQQATDDVVKKVNSAMLRPTIISIITAGLPWIFFLNLHIKIARNAMFGGINQLYEPNIFWPVFLAVVYVFSVYLGMQSILKGGEADMARVEQRDEDFNSLQALATRFSYMSIILCVITIILMIFPLFINTTTIL